MGNGLSCVKGRRVHIRKLGQAWAVERTWSRVRERSGVTLGSACGDWPFLSGRPLWHSEGECRSSTVHPVKRYRRKSIKDDFSVTSN